jgi:hypothetical protein
MLAIKELDKLEIEAEKTIGAASPGPPIMASKACPVYD